MSKCISLPYTSDNRCSSLATNKQLNILSRFWSSKNGEARSRRRSTFSEICKYVILFSVVTSSHFISRFVLTVMFCLSCARYHMCQCKEVGVRVPSLCAVWHECSTPLTCNPPAPSLLHSLVLSAAGPVSLPTRSHKAQWKLLYHIANLLSGLLKVWEAFYTYKWYIVLANTLHTQAHVELYHVILLIYQCSSCCF